MSTNSVSTLAAGNNTNQTPEIVITFDDGAKSVYTNAYPIMKQYGIKGTVFVNTAYIGQDWYMNLTDLQELHNAGWTIANHANEHIDFTNATLTNETKIYEIQTAIDWLKNNGFADGAYYFASPYGAYDDDLLNILSQLGVLVHRTTDEGYVTNPPADLLKIPDKEINGVNGYHTLDQAKSIVDGAISANATAFLLLHEILAEIASGEDGDYQWTTTNFSGLIQYISQIGVKTLTVNEWYHEVINNPAIDTTAPNISGTDPISGSINTAVNKIITITFSEAIKAGSAYDSITITDKNSAIVSGIIKSINGNVLTLTNSGNYVGGTSYFINLPLNSITDLAGNSITAFASNFTTIDNTAPTASATPTGGDYYAPQSIVLAASELSKIYYTLDGTDPTTSSNLYSGAINIGTSKTLKFRAIDETGNSSPIYTENYRIYKTEPYSYVVQVPYWQVWYKLSYQKKYKYRGKWRYKTVYIKIKQWNKRWYKYKGKWRYKWRYTWVNKWASYWLYRNETRWDNRYVLT
ncbi:MAG: polysaccharide deacetylase family protein [Methanobacterium sp.]